MVAVLEVTVHSIVLTQVVPFLVMFFTKFLSFYRKVPQSFFAPWSMLSISREEEKMPGFTR